MTPVEVILVLAALAGAATLGHHAWRKAAWSRGTDVLLRAHAAATLVALALLLVAFLASDLSYAYVFDHTRADYPLAYRVAGLWGGEEGTILLWNGLTALFTLFLLRRGDHADGVHRRAALFLVGFSTALALVNLLSRGLGATDPSRLALAPAGRGLADVLLTPLMVIHPPVQFLAYALMTPMAAYVLAGLTRPARAAAEDAWASAAYAWARWAWLFATLGLGLGALWAYYVLSFGGYWAWDPVETSNLLPWLALTAFLHAGKDLLRHRDHALAAPLLAYLAFLLTLFATFATRSGLWVSVHAFTDPTDRFEPDAGLRLLGILAAHAPTRLFLGLLTAATAAGLALFLLHHAFRLSPAMRTWLKGHALLLFALGGAALLDPATVWGLLFRAASLLPSFPLGLALVAGLLLGLPLALLYLGRDEREGRRRTLDARLLMSAAVALFALALTVTFLLNLQVVNRPERLLFDQRAPFLVLPLVAVLTVMLALAPLGRRQSLLLAGAGVVLGAACWWLFPAHRVLALSAPPLAAAALAAFLRLLHAQGRGAPLLRRGAGAVLFLSAIGAMVVSSNPPARVPDALAVPVGVAGFLLGALLLGAGVACFAKDRPSRKWGARVRETGVYLLHLAVVLGLLGYAASTYSQARATYPAAEIGEAGEVGAYGFEIGAAQALVDEDGRLSALTVPLQLDKEGDPTEQGTLRFTWEGDRYKGHLDVRRHLAEDVYLTPLAFHTADGWVGADAAGLGKARAEGIDAVTFTMAVLPLVGLVWTGLWMGVFGMALVLLGAGLLRSRERTRRVPVRTPEDPPEVRAPGRR